MEVERPCEYCWMVVTDEALGDANMGPGDAHLGAAVVAAGVVLPLNHVVTWDAGLGARGSRVPGPKPRKPGVKLKQNII